MYNRSFFPNIIILPTIFVLVFQENANSCGKMTGRLSELSHTCFDVVTYFFSIDSSSSSFTVIIDSLPLPTPTHLTGTSR